MFSKPKSSNFEAKKFVQLNIDRWLLHQNIARENTYHLVRIYFGLMYLPSLLPVIPTSMHFIARTTDTEEHNTWS